MAILKVRNATASFGSFVAFQDISIEIPEGGLVGLIGTNGAGKSTLFSAISGYVRTSQGEIHFDGHDISDRSIETRVKMGLARTFQVPREFGRLSVLDNLMAAAPDQAGERLLKLVLSPGEILAQERSLVTKAREILDFLNLSRVIDQPAGSLSGGQKKLLELGRLLMLEPKCIMLDEPFAGVNPVLIGELSLRIRELNARGIAILIIEHDLPSLSDIVSVMYAMDRGRIIASGTPDEVLSSAHVREAYMGGAI